MSIDRFSSRNWFACLLVALHTLLVGAYAWIELDGAWNDMNPTMLVMMALYVADYPIHLVLRSLFDVGGNTGSYLAAVLVLGGAFWFSVGSLISFACRVAWQSLIRSRPVANES